MPDRDAVIEGLKKVWDAFDHMEHESYADYVSDALVLLEEQETKIEQLNGYINWFSKDAVPVIRCQYCRQHGKDTCSAVAGIAYPTPDDWFCADGERR